MVTFYFFLMTTLDAGKLRKLRQEEPDISRSIITSCIYLFSADKNRFFQSTNLFSFILNEIFISRRNERLRKCRFSHNCRAGFTTCWRRMRNRIHRAPGSRAIHIIFHRHRRSWGNRNRHRPRRKRSRTTLRRCEDKNRYRTTRRPSGPPIFPKIRKRILITQNRRASPRSTNDPGRRRNRNTANIVRAED